MPPLSGVAYERCDVGNGVVMFVLHIKVQNLRMRLGVVLELQESSISSTGVQNHNLDIQKVFKFDYVRESHSILYTETHGRLELSSLLQCCQISTSRVK